MTAGHASGGEALGGWPKSGGAGHVTHTRARLVGGRVCVDISIHLCLELNGQSLEECRLSDLSRENSRKLSFKRKAICSSFGDPCLTFNPCQKVYRDVQRRTNKGCKKLIFPGVRLAPVVLSDLFSFLLCLFVQCVIPFKKLITFYHISSQNTSARSMWLDPISGKVWKIHLTLSFA